MSHYEQDVSGFWYLIPTEGRWGAQALRDQADKLDEMNAEWKAVVDASQSDRGDKPTSSTTMPGST